MTLIGLAGAFIATLLADIVGQIREDEGVRGLARTGFAVLVAVDVGILPGLVDTAGSIVAFAGGLVG